MSSDICKLLGIKYPIIQGAMAWISESNLVSAVSNAGGLGVLATGHLNGETAREEIKKIKSMTDKPYAVNIMLLSPFADDIAKVVCEEKVPVVTTGAGSPSKYMASFKEANIKVLPVIPSVAIAKRMASDGADAVIIEGMEAGGHIGKTTTMALLPQVIDAVSIPVVAAGGIADGRGMAACKIMGAAGFQIGTRFLVANECVVHDNYKKRIIKATDIDTVTSGQSTGHPVRVIKNKLSKAYEELEKNGADPSEIENLGRGALRKAVIDGDIANGSVMSGQIAGMVKKEQSCLEIIEEMHGEYIKLMQNASSMI